MNGIEQLGLKAAARAFRRRGRSPGARRLSSLETNLKNGPGGSITEKKKRSAAFSPTSPQKSAPIAPAAGLWRALRSITLINTVILTLPKHAAHQNLRIFLKDSTLATYCWQWKNKLLSKNNFCKLLSAIMSKYSFYKNYTYKAVLKKLLSSWSRSLNFFRPLGE